MRPTDEGYALGDDGLIVEKVGPWAKEKLRILTHYIQISSAARRKFLRNEPAYLDVFCGPGRSKIRTTDEHIDGSPIAAFQQGKGSPAPFSSIEISDADHDLLGAAEKRLRLLQAPVRATPGPAINAIDQIIASLNPNGLHLAFLDPHNLGSLSFKLFESLAPLKYLDILVHVSVSDMQRNLDRYTSEEHEEFDDFAPGWRDAIGVDMNQAAFRAAILEYWTKKVSALGLPRAEHCDLISGPSGQRLYWLMLLSGNKLAHQLWEKISSLAKAPRLDLG